MIYNSEKKNNYITYFSIILLVTTAGMVIRFLGRNVISGDFRDCLEPWYKDIIASGTGISSLRAYKGDYALPYVFLTWLIGKLPIPYLYACKILSIIFDVLMAVFAGMISALLTPERKYSFLFGYSIVLLLPNVIIDSAYWGQCDSIYTAFILLSLWLYLKDRYTAMMLVYGIAMAFKLQSVFFLPFILIVYWFEKKFSILHFLLIPAGMILCNIPAYMAGFPFSITFSQYVSQTGTYPWLYYFYPNLYFFFQARPYYFFSIAPICFTVTMLLILVFLLRKHKLQLSGENALNIATWICYTCVFLLPSMHERYGYLAEILAVLAAIKNKRLTWLPILMIASTLPRFLFAISLGSGSLIQQGICSVLNTVSYTAFTYMIYLRLKDVKS
jgi:Gpi18-like mannosyltransferase